MNLTQMNWCIPCLPFDSKQVKAVAESVNKLNHTTSQEVSTIFKTATGFVETMKIIKYESNINSSS